MSTTPPSPVRPDDLRPRRRGSPPVGAVDARDRKSWPHVLSPRGEGNWSATALRFSPWGEGARQAEACLRQDGRMRRPFSAMPIPTHIFNPPFNVVRCSHTVLTRARPRRQPRLLRGHHRPAGGGCRQGRDLFPRHGGAQPPLARAEAGAGAGGRAARLQGRQRGGPRPRARLLQGAPAASTVRRGAVPGPHAACGRHRRATRWS